MKENKTLTKAEMEIMNYLWDIGGEGGTVRDVLERYPAPPPAYTTTATFLKILTQKGFVATEKRKGEGKTYLFRPLISRDEYRKRVVEDVKDSFFGGSVKSLVSFFVQEEKLSETELKELLEMVSQGADRVR
ncbi:MAG: BlaI/MecI/CopY family transcriptional regulator [Bacteroidaceae bacterium]|nr:BlaI/MecI/CopY family transcriptional regulator [Bacteroidaceae bacterium]